MSDTEPSSDDGQQLRRLADMILEAGYKARIEEVERLVQSAANGLKFTVRPYPNATVQFAMGISTPADRFSEHEMNEFNKRYRFSKAYRMTWDSGDSSIILEADFFLDLDSDDAQQAVERCFDVWSLSIRTFVDALVEKPTA